MLSGNMTEKILISACLMGREVRYDGAHKRLEHETLARWRSEGRLVEICPELLGGLGVPRAPAEIACEDPLTIKGVDGKDYTKEFLKGAHAALKIAQENGCKYALLKEYSPTCGSSMIYDGNFKGGKIAGYGVAARIFKANGIEVFSDENFGALVETMAH